MRYVSAEGLPPVSKVGLGTMRFGEKSFPPQLARAIVRRALELGITHFDTAESYGFGRSERLLGEALAAEGAADVVVTGKYSPLVPAASVMERHARASRGRLGVGAISLYLVHMPNPLVPAPVTAAGFRRSLAGGVIGAAGVSNHSLRQWQAAEAALGAPVVANEVLLNVLRPKATRTMVPWAAERRRLVIAASPLGQGLLAGRYSAQRPPRGLATHRRLAMRFASVPPTAAGFRRLAPLTDQLASLAARHGVTPAAIALAWAIRFDPVVVIPGASSVSQVEDNAAACDVTLSDADLRALADAAAESAPARRKGTTSGGPRPTA